MPDLGDYGSRALASLAELGRANEASVLAAAKLVVDVGRAGHRVHAAGAGHSLAGVLEMFYRAGGLAFVNPIWHPDILPLNNAIGSTLAERQDGVGREVTQQAGVSQGDAVFVYSTSGINAFPVEVAETARSAGASVVAVTSVAASSASPLRATRRLYELANVVLDTLVPPGDVTWPPNAPQIAPASSLANVYCWNLVMVEALRLDPELPTWRSANASAGDANAALLNRYRGLVPALGG